MLRKAAALLLNLLLALPSRAAEIRSNGPAGGSPIQPVGASPESPTPSLKMSPQLSLGDLTPISAESTQLPEASLPAEPAAPASEEKPPAQEERPRPAQFAALDSLGKEISKSQGTPGPALDKTFDQKGSGPRAGTAVAALASALSFSPFLLGSVADSPETSSVPGASWETRFPRELAASYRPGDLFRIENSRHAKIVLEGVERGHLFRVKDDGVASSYLYAVPAGATAHIEQSIRSAVARHNSGEDGAALVFLARARMALLRQGAPGREGLALVNTLMGNVLVAVYRNYAGIHPLPPPARHFVQAPYQPLNLNTLVFARNVGAVFADDRVPADYILGPIKGIAEQVAAALPLPQELDTPETRREAQSFVRNFPSRILRDADGEMKSFSPLSSIEESELPHLTQKAGLAQGAFQKLSGLPALSLDALGTLVGVIGRGDPAARRRAADLLGNQVSLPPSIRSSLEDLLVEGDLDARRRAAALLLAANPGHPAALEISASAPTEDPPADLRDAYARAFLSSDRWAPRQGPTRSQVKSLARTEFREEFPRADAGFVDRFLERAAEYAGTVNRLIKVLLRGLEGGLWEDPPLLDPHSQYSSDMQLKLKMERLLSGAIPVAWSKTSAALGSENDVSGIFVVGSFTGHPSLTDEDRDRPEDEEAAAAPTRIDVLVVSKDGHAFAAEKFIAEFEAAMRLAARQPSAHFFRVRGGVRTDSLNFWRELELGSLFIDATGRRATRQDQAISFEPK